MKRTPIKQVSAKQKAKQKAFEAAKEESFARSEVRCLICGRVATDGHHFIYRSHCGENVPENIIPLCVTHHTGELGVHRGITTHMDIYSKALEKRQDIAAYSEKRIRDWAKRADPELVDRLIRS